MTQINLPNQSVTGANLWSQVEDNDQAIADVVNGNLENDNIATGADIDGAKLLAASVDTAQLAADAVTGAKIEDDAVDTEHIADSAVETAQINDGAVTAAKFAAPTTTTATIASGATGTITARKELSGLVIVYGSVTKSNSPPTVWSPDDTDSPITLATLPEGYRPTQTLVFSIRNSWPSRSTRYSVQTIEILTTGVIRLMPLDTTQGIIATETSTAHLAGIIFVAA